MQKAVTTHKEQNWPHRCMAKCGVVARGDLVMKFFGTSSGALTGLLLLVLAGCTSSTSAVDNSTNSNAATNASSETTSDNAETTETQLGTVINKPGNVKNRGVYIKMLVNKVPVTNSDINRRTAFLKLRREPGNRAQKAEQEMIEQILKLQEAM